MIYEYTADDEYPDCMACENINIGRKIDGVDYCYARCGAENFWNGYVRYCDTEESKEE